MRLVLVSVFTLILAAPQARAEPGPVVRYLKSEPASLFDIGQDRVAYYLQSERDWFEQSLLREYREFIGKDFKEDSLTGTTGIGVGTAVVEYDAPENLISISSRIYVTYYMDPERIRPMCAKLVDYIREVGGVIYGEIRDGKYSAYAAKFAHLGYENKQQPKDYRQRLDRIFQIKVAVYGSESFRPVLWCQGMLLSDEVTFTE